MNFLTSTMKKQTEKITQLQTHDTFHEKGGVIPKVG